MSFEYTLTDTLLKVEKVSMVYNGFPVLRDVNLEIKDIVRPGMSQGQVVGLLGPSGRGKTQLFRIIAGLQQPTTGRVLINSTGEPVRAGMVGVVPQNYILFEDKTVLRNLIIAARQGGADRKTAKDKAMAYLERFRLIPEANKYPSQLSGGQRQRVAIARQLLCSEHFLLMDEPTTGLDVVMKRKILEMINEVATGHELNTIIMVTHDIPAALSVADRIWLLGYERDEKGNAIPGARVVDQYDLIERDLAWRPDIRKLPHFQDLVNEITDRFETL